MLRLRGLRLFSRRHSRHSHGSGAWTQDVIENWQHFESLVLKQQSKGIAVEIADISSTEIQSSFELIADEQFIGRMVHNDRLSAQSNYLLYTIIRLFIHLKDIHSAFSVFTLISRRFMTRDVVVIPSKLPTPRSKEIEKYKSKTILDQNTVIIDVAIKRKTWARQNVPFPLIHFELLRLFEGQKYIQRDFAAQLLRLQLKLHDEFTPYQMNKIFEKLLMLPNLSEFQIQKAFNVMLNIYKLKAEDMLLMNTCFNTMRTKYNIQPTLSNYTTMLQSYMKFKQFEPASALFKDMMDQGLHIDQHVVNIMVRVFCYTERHKEAVEMVESMERNGTLSTLETWSSLIKGFSELPASSLGAMEKAEELYLALVDRHLVPDVVVYTIMIEGYMKRKDLEQVMKWTSRLFDAGVAPDAYLFSILQRFALKNPTSTFITWFDSTFGAKTSKYYRLIVRQPVTPFSNAVADAQLLKEYMFHSGDIEGRNSIMLIKKLVRLKKDPVAVSMALSAYIRTPAGREAIPYLLKHIAQADVRISAEVISLLILLIYHEGTEMEQAWKLYDGIWDAAIYPTDIMMRNMFLICVKTNDPRRLDELITVLTSRVSPINASIFRMMIGILTCYPRGSIATVGKTRMKNIERIERFPVARTVETYHFYSRVSNREPTDNTTIQNTALLAVGKKFTRAAITLMRDRFSRNLTITDDHFQYLVDDALNCTNAEVLMVEIFGMLQVLDKESSLFLRLQAVFYGRLFHFSDWRIAYFFIYSHLQDPESVVFQFLLDYIKKRGEKHDFRALWTAWSNLKEKNPHPIIITLLIEQLGIYCKAPGRARAILESIPRWLFNEEMLWAYVRSLIWGGQLEKAITMCTVNYLPKDTDNGKVVIEFRRWLKLKELKELEDEIVNYWKLKKPDWVI